MDINELRSKDAQSLGKELSELRHEAFRLRMSRNSGQLAKPSEIKRVRREVARVLTILNERKTSGDSQ